MQATIGIIGAGNMATSIILGLLDNNWPIEHLLVSCLTPAKHSQLSDRGIRFETNNRDLTEKSDVVILATKPQQASTSLQNLQSSLKGKCLISVAAGLSTDLLNLTRSSAGPLLKKKTHETIDLFEAIKKGEIVYFLLDSMSEKETSEMLGRLLLQDLITTTGYVYNKVAENERRQTLNIGLPQTNEVQTFYSDMASPFGG